MGSPADGAVPDVVKNQVAPEREGSPLSTVPAVQSPTGLVHPSFVARSRTVASKALQLGAAWAAAMPVSTASAERLSSVPNVDLMAPSLSLVTSGRRCYSTSFPVNAHLRLPAPWSRTIRRWPPPIA
jgi:hypothetical protein